MEIKNEKFELEWDDNENEKCKQMGFDRRLSRTLLQNAQRPSEKTTHSKANTKGKKKKEKKKKAKEKAQQRTPAPVLPLKGRESWDFFVFFDEKDDFWYEKCVVFLEFLYFVFFFSLKICQFKTDEYFFHLEWSPAQPAAGFFRF